MLVKFDKKIYIVYNNLDTKHLVYVTVNHTLIGGSEKWNTSKQLSEEMFWKKVWSMVDVASAKHHASPLVRLPAQ